MSEEYANLEVNRVILHANASAYTNADAVPKSYVDQVKSDILGGNDISQALDTLKEIGAYLVDNTVANGLVQQLYDISGRITTEEINRTNAVQNEQKRASDEEGYLNARISSEETNREQAMSAEAQRVNTITDGLSSAILQETNDRSSAIASEIFNRTEAIAFAVGQEASARAESIGLEISNRTSADDALDVKISNERARAEDVESNKADLSGAVFSGDVQLSDSYLQFGLNWRVKGSHDGSRLVFEHLRNNVWKTAVPFISSV